MWWPGVVKSEWELQFPLKLDYGRSPHAYVNQWLQIQLELQIMSGVPLERCWAFNERRNNKFCCKVASCWLFLLNHTTMHGSINIKFKDMHQFLIFILFCSSILHVSDGLSIHHQESKTVHTASGIYQTDSADCLLTGTRWNWFNIVVGGVASSQ